MLVFFVVVVVFLLSSFFKNLKKKDQEKKKKTNILPFPFYLDFTRQLKGLILSVEIATHMQHHLAKHISQIALGTAPFVFCFGSTCSKINLPYLTKAPASCSGK